MVSKKKTKTPILTERIENFVLRVKLLQKVDGSFDTKKLSALWEEEVRYHFDNGRAQKTLELYIVKYRYALKDTFGTKSSPMAICNMKKLRERLDNFIQQANLPKSGIAISIEEKIEKAEGNVVGRKPRFLMRVSDFISNINLVTTKDEMIALWNKELDSMADKSKATTISYITKYRNAIREAYGDEHPILRIAAGSPELYDEARRIKMEKIANKHNSLIVFKNYEEVMSICREALTSNNPMVIAVGLMGTTGRRPYEIFTQAILSPAPYAQGVSKWSVLFSGQAKTKQGEGTKYGITYEIPVLEKSSIVLRAYEKLRESAQGKKWLGMNVDEFTADARLPLRDRVNNMFGHLWPAAEIPRPYGLRHLYAELAYRNFAPPHVTKNSYFAAILGHNNNDLETSLSYMSYAFPEDAAEARARAHKLSSRTLNQMNEYRSDHNQG